MRILRFNTILKHGVSTACLHPGLKSLRFNIILKLAFLCSNLHGLRSIWFNTILKRDRRSCALNTGLRDLRFNIILKPLHTIIPKHAWLKSLRFNTILKLIIEIIIVFARLKSLRFNIILKPQKKYGSIPQKRAAKNQKIFSQIPIDIYYFSMYHLKQVETYDLTT